MEISNAVIVPELTVWLFLVYFDKGKINVVKNKVFLH